MKASPLDERSVVCPLCNAGVGEPCQTRWVGNPLDGYHDIRSITFAARQGGRNDALDEVSDFVESRRANVTPIRRRGTGTDC